MQSLWYDWAYYGTNMQSKKLNNILYMTLVQDPDMKRIKEIMERVVGRMIQLWIYKTSKNSKVG